MSRKTNILVTQGGWERYVDEAAADVMSIFQNDYESSTLRTSLIQQERRRVQQGYDHIRRGV